MDEHHEVSAARLKLRQQLWENRRELTVPANAKRLVAREQFPRSTLMRALTNEKGRKVILAASTALLTKPKLRWAALATIAGVVAVGVWQQRHTSET